MEFGLGERIQQFSADVPENLKFNKSLTKKAGFLRLGPQLCSSPVKCVANCLARRDGTDVFHTAKILTLPDPSKVATTDDIQGKILINTEYVLLKMLQGQKGVIQQYGMYKDLAEEEVEIEGKSYLTGKTQSRLILVLDCYTPHDYSPKYTRLVNLQQYVIKEKRLPESLAIKIFYNVVQVVCNLHRQNIVHRDLKLGNIVLDKDTKDITLTNFGLGKHLIQENEQLRDQRGSPAYISPDVISGKPYLGKPSDMWALGVVLYTMLYGQFPFYDSSPAELFRKIKIAEYQIPTEFVVSLPTVKLIQSLLVLDPKVRLTASETLEKLEDIILAGEVFLVDSDLQVVPDFSLGSDYEDEPRSRRIFRQSSFPEVNGTDIEQMLAELSNPVAASEESKDEDEMVHEPPSKVARNAQDLKGLLNLKVTRCLEEPLKVLTPADIASLRANTSGVGQGLSAARSLALRSPVPSQVFNSIDGGVSSSAPTGECNTSNFVYNRSSATTSTRVVSRAALATRRSRTFVPKPSINVTSSGLVSRKRSRNGTATADSTVAPPPGQTMNRDQIKHLARKTLSVK